MKRSKVWSVSPIIVLFGLLSFLLLLTVFFVHRTVFWFAAFVSVLVWAYGIYRLFGLKRDLHRYVRGLGEQLNYQNREELEETPLPIVLISEQDEIVWYNELFHREVLGGTDRLGEGIHTVFPTISSSQLSARFLKSEAKRS